MSNDHHRHGGHHAHVGAHASMWLTDRRGGDPIHRVGRRQFLADVGRNTLAIVVLGGAAAACSSGDDSDSTAGATTPPSTEPAPTAVATSPPSTETESSSTAARDDESALRWAQARLGSVSAYVLVRGNEAAVVDTGSSGSTAEIGTALSALGVTFDDVRHVVLTHSHPDHIGSLPGVLGEASSASAYAGTLDVPNISAPIEVMAVSDGDDVFGLQVIDTPGHTPGSISMFDPGIGLLLAGDALNGNGDGTGLSGPDDRYTSDMSTANDSVGKLAALDVEAVGMGHGQPVSSGAGALLTALAAES